MPKQPPTRRKVSFVATKRVTVPRKVSFTTKNGQRVSFTVRRSVVKPVRITFYTRAKRKK